MNDDAGRHEHEPAPRQLVPPPRQRAPGRRRRRPTRRCRPTQTRPASAGGGEHQGRRPSAATWRHRRAGSRSAGASRTGPRRRRPTPGCRPARTPPCRRARWRRGRGRAGDRLTPAPVPSTIATAATTSDAGIVALATVSVTTPGIARATAPTAQPTHAARVPATCTARLWSPSASPIAAPPATATASQGARAAHTTTWLTAGTRGDRPAEREVLTPAVRPGTLCDCTGRADCGHRGEIGQTARQWRRRLLTSPRQPRMPTGSSPVAFHGWPICGPARRRASGRCLIVPSPRRCDSRSPSTTCRRSRHCPGAAPPRA